MLQQDEADSSPADSFTPDTAAEPVEMQSPEGQLPLDETPLDEAAGEDASHPAEDVIDDLPDRDAPVAAAIAGAMPGGARVYDWPADVVQASEVESPALAESPPVEVLPPAVDAEPDDVLLPPVEPPPPVKEPRRLPRAARETVDRQRRYFAACGRCGYFVADCCLLLGEEVVQDAILDADDGWVRLEGNEAFGRLLQNAYGVHLDAGYSYLDGSCPECRRRYVYMEQDDGPTRLKIRTNKPY